MPKRIKIPGRQYKTINDCLAAFFNCEVSELSEIAGKFRYALADGEEKSEKVQEVMHRIRKGPCWAWVEGKSVIHYFVRSRATMSDLVKMFAHELAHRERPWHRSLKEEQKANKAADIASAAYQMAVQTYKGLHREAGK